MKKILLILLALASPVWAQPFQGWGSSTTGGQGGTTVHVTNLNDSGAGSLRQALQAGGTLKNIVFDVQGTITLTDDIQVQGTNYTIDGTTAPGNGITISGAGLRFEANTTNHDFIIKNLRFRNCAGTEGDCITIRNNAYNFVIDHVSTNNPTDGNMDFTVGAHDITVQYSILSTGSVAMLCANQSVVGEGTQHCSIHNNLFINSQWRNPDVGCDGTGNITCPYTQMDFRNNIVWEWGTGGGSIWQCGATGNDVANYYYTSNLAGSNGPIVKECPDFPTNLPTVYTSANVGGNNNTTAINNAGTTGSEFPAATVTTLSACLGAHVTLAGVGAQPRDATDSALLGQINGLPGCPCL